MFRRPWLRAVLSIAALGGLIYYGVRHPQVVHRALDFGWFNLAVLALSYALAQWLNGLVLKVGLSPPYSRIKLGDAVGINLTSSLAGYLTPLRLGGMSSRLLMLKVRCGVAPGYALGQFLLVTLITIGLSALLFVVAFVVQGGELLARYRIAAAFMGAIAVAVALLCAALSHPRAYAFLKPRLPAVLVGVHEAMARPWRYQAQVLALLAATFLLQVLQTQWLLLAVGLDGDWIFSILVCAIANLMLVLSLTPANIGVKEALLGSLAFAFLIDEKAFVGALLVDRVVQVAVLVLGVSAYSAFAKDDRGD